MKWILYISFILANIVIAFENDYVRRYRIRHGITKQIEHFWYGLGYCVLCSVPFFWIHDWRFISSIILLHASIFPVAFNLFKYGGKKPFDLSLSTTAIYDTTLARMNFKSMLLPDIIFQVASFTFLILTDAR